MKASAFAGQNKTPEAFEKAAANMGLQKRNSPNVKEMDNYLMGLPTAREIVRWAYAESTKTGEVSPVFDLTGKYAVAILKGITKKGVQSMEEVKKRIEPSVKNSKKADMIAEKMTKAYATTKDINALAAQFGSKVDTTVITFLGYSRSALGRENEIIGKLFTLPKGQLTGPLTGNFGAYFVIVDEVTEPATKEDFTMEKMQEKQQFEQRVSSFMYPALQKSAKIVDSRLRFY